MVLHLSCIFTLRAFIDDYKLTILNFTEKHILKLKKKNTKRFRVCASFQIEFVIKKKFLKKFYNNSNPNFLRCDFKTISIKVIKNNNYKNIQK